jgi:hypothetical protein
MGGCALSAEIAKRRVAAGFAVAPARCRAFGEAQRGRAAAGHSFADVAVAPPCTACASRGGLAAAGGQRQGKGGGSATRTAPATDRAALFCHKCAQKKTLKVAFYLQATTTTSEDSKYFARIFLLGRNVDLDIETAGVIPTTYNEQERKLGRVETVADLCDVLKALETQGSLPKAGALPVVLVPFGKQLRGDAGDTLGWHIPDTNKLCGDRVGTLKAARIVAIDSDPETGHPKVLLHEIGHAVGNVDLSDSSMIMGPANPGGGKKAPIGCDPDAKDNLMIASEVERFCKGSF